MSRESDRSKASDRAWGRRTKPGDYELNIGNDARGEYFDLALGPRAANPEVYVRGSVRHPDRATIELEGWHRVFINAELTLSEVGFLD